MKAPELPTDLQIIESYIGRRDKIAAMTKDFDASIAPFKEQMKTLENEMLRRLIERNAEHSNTDAGTAYKEQTMQVKCLNKWMFHQYCLRNYDDVGKDLLTANVGKEALKLVIDKSKSEVNPNGVVPPGLQVNFETVVRFRKA